MTGLRKWRKIAENFILFFIAWEVAVTIVSLALLMFVTVRGGTPSPDSLISVLGTLGFYGVLIWAIRDVQGEDAADPWSEWRPQRKRPRAVFPCVAYPSPCGAGVPPAPRIAGGTPAPQEKEPCDREPL